MTTVAKLLENKGGVVWSIKPDASVYEALESMNEKSVGALLVMEDSELLGIISERDYARKVILNDRASRTTHVKEIMTAEVKTVGVHESIEKCMAIMTRNHFRHLPVTKDNQIVGMITLGDVVKEIIAQQQDKIEELEHTITWGESY